MVRLGDRVTRTRLTSASAVVQGETDREFWLVDQRGRVHRYVDGRPTGAPVPMPVDTFLVRGVTGGLLVAPATNETGIRVWDPVRRRDVRRLADGGYGIGYGARTVVWAELCGRPTCPTHATDLVTGRDSRVPLPDGAGSVALTAVDPTGTSIAYAWNADDRQPASIYTVRLGDRRPTLVAQRVPADQILLDWAEPDLLVLVQAFPDQAVVFTWDRPTGTLRRAGVHAIEGALWLAVRSPAAS